MGTITVERLTLKEIMKRVNKWFMIKKVKIEFTENVKEGEYDDETKIIRINPNLSKEKFAQVYIHELLHHDWQLDHEPFTRAICYRSYGYKKDRLSVLLYQDIFRRNASWLRRAR